MSFDIKSLPIGLLPPPTPKQISQKLGIDSVEIDWLAGDGSDRCYYRIHSEEIIGSHVLMQLSDDDAKLLQKGGYEWVEIADLLSKKGIFVPKVIATMPAQAALIIEDYGNDMLETLVQKNLKEDNWEKTKFLYAESSDILASFLKINKKYGGCWVKRAFDSQRFEWELNFFLKKYLYSFTSIKLPDKDVEQLTQDIKSLSSYLYDVEKYFVHRDFHSRNILYLKKRLAIIDFQDARLGPAPYDLVSLCFDSYVDLSKEQRLELFNQGAEIIANKCNDATIKSVEALWKPVLLQRQLKAIGSFGYLTKDKKRGNYLQYVKPALDILLNHELYDKRWPFLSKKLLELMQESVK